jgi:hypothetical protein
MSKIMKTGYTTPNPMMTSANIQQCYVKLNPNVSI